VQFVELTLFPSRLLSLKQCKNAEEVSLWKRMLFKDIKDKQVQGEPEQDNKPFDLDPQEENKEELPMPQKVFVEAKALQDD
jgi:hypothetical protein